MGLAGRSDKACAVCAAAVAKYSCPQCRAAYCGVACCRDHKESCAGPAAPAAPGAARCGPVAAPRDAAAANDEDDETNVLSDAHKQQLSQCGWLRQALGRRGVLELLGRILSAPHRGHALRVPPSCIDALERICCAAPAANGATSPAGAPRRPWRSQGPRAAQRPRVRRARRPCDTSNRRRRISPSRILRGTEASPGGRRGRVENARRETLAIAAGMLLELGICIRDGAGVTFVGAEARLPPAGAGAPGGQRCAA